MAYLVIIPDSQALAAAGGSSHPALLCHIHGSQAEEAVSKRKAVGTGGHLEKLQSLLALMLCL